MPRGLPKIAPNFILSTNKFGVVLKLTTRVSRKPRPMTGSSDTNREINLNYRDAPPCSETGILVRRGASFAGIYLNFGGESIGIEVILVKLKQ